MKLSTRKFAIYSSILVCLLAVSCGQKDTVNSKNPVVVPNDFLSAVTYDQLIIEIQSVNGFAPSASTVSHLTSLLQLRLNKPGGISVVQTTIPSPGKSAFALSDVQAIENTHRTMKTNGKILTAYFFFADGDYSANSGNSKVLGVAYGSTSMVIFEKTIKDFSGGISQPATSTLETTVLEHEFGHTLGLVNRGSTMQAAHEDATNQKHCTNQNCLMYFNVETSDVVINMTGGNIPSLDTNCINDLKANGGK